MNFDNILIRCSSIYKIMTGIQGKTNKDKWVDACAEHVRLTKLYEATKNKSTDAQAKRFGKIQELKREIDSLTPVKDDIELGQTAKTYLRKLYLEQKYGLRQEFTSKYVEKGKQQEELGITLYSLHKQETTGKTIFYKKNDIRINNEYLSGEPDLFTGESIYNADEGVDIKCPYGLWTFPFFETALPPQYEWQNHGYIALTGAKQWTTGYTLVNAPASLIDDEKRRVKYAMNLIDADKDPDYVKKCIEIEKNMIFDMEQFLSDNPWYDLHCKEWKYDIPRSERVKEFVTERDDIKIELVYATVRKCRKYMEETFGGTDNLLIASPIPDGVLIERG